VEEVDGVLFEVSALVIVLDDHSDVFVSGHALHLTAVNPKLNAHVTAVRLRSWGESFNLGFGFFLDPKRSGSSLSGF
jgi:hypothetical protein